MENIIIEILHSTGPLAILISILLNVLISIAGIIPSVFITAANITVFGFEQGLLLSFIGECAGAFVSFWLYRKGLKAFNPKILQKNKWFERLRSTRGLKSFYMILMLRLLPFVPSGLINVAAALSKISALLFITASTLGKLPALLIEAYSVRYALESTGIQKMIILGVAAFSVLIYFFQKMRREKKI